MQKKKKRETGPTTSQQEKTLLLVKKHFKESATVRNQEDCIKVNTKALYDADVEFLTTLQGMQKEVEIHRSGSGVVIILNF
jgi:hypothetical protein